jgi:molecular chaperone DnaK
LIYSTEKSLKDLGDKVDAETRNKVEAAIGPLKKAMESDNAEEIRRLSDELTQASHKLAEAMYQQASSGAGAGGGADDAGASGGQTGQSGADDVVDADFEEVKEEKK